MKVLETQSARLTNYEVLQRIKEYEAEHDGTDGTGRKRDMPPNLKQVIKDLKENLQRPDAPLHPDNSALYTDSATETLFKRLDAKYAFLASEYMMFFNLRPKNVVELTTIVEDLDKRFSEQEQEDILTIIAEVLGEPVIQEEEGEEGEEAEAGAE